MAKPQVTDVLFRLIYTFKTRLSEEFEAEGMNIAPMHIKVLKMVSSIDRCTAQVIAEQLQRDKAQITRLVKELVTKGLIEREPNPADKRSQLLRSTSEGVEALRKMAAIEKRIFSRITKSMSAEDQQSFMALAGKLQESLKN